MQSTVTYEELIQLEKEFDDVDLEIMRKQYVLTTPLYAKRQQMIAKIPNFWALVFEQAPPEVDTYIQPSDSQLFAECLKSLEVPRFEINPAPVAGAEPEGSPRSLSIKMEFGPNEWFENDVLEKKFWFRRAKDNWTGLVSEPVQIRWKKGKDLTHGLTDAATKLWEARQRLVAAEGELKDSEAEELEALAEKLEQSDEAAPSFFALFSFVSGRRYVSAEESAAANAAEAERREKRRNGEKVEEPEQEESEELDPFAETLPNGDDLPVLLAEEVWPNALKYFTQAQEMGDDELSEIDFEDDEEEMDDDEGAEPIDIRSLVKGKRKERDGLGGDAGPKKARKK